MATWQVARISGRMGSTWRVASVSGSMVVPVSADVLLADIPDRTASSFDLVTVKAVPTADSATPDSYVFTLLPNGLVHTLPMTVLGNLCTFRAPGRFDGCDVQIRVDALAGGAIQDSKIATIHVAAHSDYIRVDGAWVAISAPQVLSTATAPVAPVVSTNALLAEDGAPLSDESGTTITTEA